MASLPTQLSSTCDSVKNNSLLNYHVEGPFVRVGNTNRDKRGWTFCPGWSHQPGQKGGLLSRLVSPTGTKGSYPPLARLAVGSGTKATFCSGPKGNQDKWPGTKAYSVVMPGLKKNRVSNFNSRHLYLFYLSFFLMGGDNPQITRTSTGG